MKIRIADTGKLKKRFLNFRKSILKSSNFVDNDYFMVKKILDKNTVFFQSCEAFGVFVEDDASNIKCEGIIAYSDRLPEYIQLCFFQTLDGETEAVKCLTDYVEEYGVKKSCTKLSVGLNGHLNYGLGLLSSDYDSKNSFSSPANLQFTNDCFKELGFDEILLNSYLIEKFDNRLDKYRKIHDRLMKKYTFRSFNKKNFDNDSELFTDLNNEIFTDHKFYYKRTYEEDKEMLKELFLFMKEDSVFYIYDIEKPVGFFMWYPDFNELAKEGDIFGAKHYIKSLFKKKYKTGKFMAFGLLPEYRNKGLPISIAFYIKDLYEKHGIYRLESSWILADNSASNNVADTICDRLYKKYTVFEKELYGTT